MAIAFDASGGGSNSGASITFNHTCTGSNRWLHCSVYITDTGVSVTATATYNSVAMTAVKDSGYDANSRRLYQFSLFAPASGTNSLVVTLSGTPAQVAGATSTSYTGVDQGGLDGAAAAYAQATSNTISTSRTTVANNAWVIGAGGTTGTVSSIDNSGTQRGSNNSGAICFDLGPVTPAGSVTLGYTDTTSGQDVRESLVAIAPAATAATGNFFLLF